MSTKSSCPYCGYTINAVTDKTCPNCGAPVPPQAVPPLPMNQPPAHATVPSYEPAPNRGNVAGVVSAVLFIVVLVVGLASFSSFYGTYTMPTTSFRLPPVFVSDVLLHINYPSSADNYLGPSNRSIAFGPSSFFEFGASFQVNFNLTMSGERLMLWRASR